MILSLTYFIHS